MINISNNLLYEIIQNASVVSLIDRPDVKHEFRRDEMLICGVPSEDGSMFGYFTCHTARDIIGVPRGFVTWFLCEGFFQMKGLVVVGPCDPAVSGMVRGNSSVIKDIINSIEDELPQRSRQLAPIVIIAQQKNPQISPRIYWKAQRRYDPSARCPNRGRLRQRR